MSETEEIVKTSFRLAKSLLREAKHYATDHDMTDTEVFTDALTQYLRGKKK